MPDILALIKAKRDGRAHPERDIRWLLATLDQVPDYQLSAWLMACVCNGLTVEETTWLTDGMARSGEMLDLSDVPGPRVDKHSTGGVGDKVSLVLAPLVAANGATMAKLSGRGLGHTGGTIDKLESFAGFRTDLSPEAFKAQLQAIRVAIAGQSGRLAPADGRLYALRDVTGTVESPGLICASILSKKIAAGADAILLDVKTGAGAFMETEGEAADLALLMQQVGQRLGRQVVCAVSEMGQPLGRAVGNAIEVVEALETLAGRGPEDLRELCVSLGALLLEAGGVVTDLAAARRRLETSLSDGSALAKFREMVAHQGGDPAAVDDPARLPGAAHRHAIRATAAGYVTAIHARAVGEAASLLGAGRRVKGDVLDLGAGVILLRKVGDPVAAGEQIADLLTNDPSRLPAAEMRLADAFSIGQEAVPPPPLIKAVFGTRWPSTASASA
ncbi:MAG: thymidine phosphorylase [Candidatus Sericytochromatia bacterium]|nr:thymidine phosphorylase [Candidatus Tanganyikabacteria bacterium]